MFRELKIMVSVVGRFFFGRLTYPERRDRAAGSAPSQTCKVDWYVHHKEVDKIETHDHQIHKEPPIRHPE